MSDDGLTDQQIDALWTGWPWTREEVETALRMAEREGWPLDDTVRALDALAAGYGGDSDPVEVVRGAIEYKRKQETNERRRRWSGS